MSMEIEQRPPLGSEQLWGEDDDKQEQRRDMLEEARMANKDEVRGFRMAFDCYR